MTIVFLLLVLVLTTAACAPSSTSTPPEASPRQTRSKSLTIGVTTQVQAMGAFAGQSVGGWTSLTEIHSAGLVTSDYSTNNPICAAT